MLLWKPVREVINITYDAFLNDDKEEAQRITPLGMVIGRLCDELKMHHVARMSKGGCGLEEGAVFTDLLNSFNRIASHCASARWHCLRAMKWTQISISMTPKSIRRIIGNIILI